MHELFDTGLKATNNQAITTS